MARRAASTSAHAQAVARSGARSSKEAAGRNAAASRRSVTTRSAAPLPTDGGASSRRSMAPHISALAADFQSHRSELSVSKWRFCQKPRLERFSSSPALKNSCIMSMPASDGRFDAVAPNLRPY